MTTNRRRSKKRRPDEAFVTGPIRGARFGKNVLLQSKWPEGAFVEMQNRAVECLPKVVQEIDALVREIARLVSELPPEQLLHRAWWQMANLHTKVKAESEIEWEDGVSIRMVDYIQSVIAAVPPAPGRRQEITEEEWQTLAAKVDELFRKVNLEYQICLTAKNKAEDPHLNEDFEEFRFKAQLHWCNDLRSADALQLAAAVFVAEAGPSTLEFVSLDDRLLTAARREGFSTTKPAP